MNGDGPREWKETMKTTYTTDLGKCYAKTSDGRIRAYKDGGLFRLYLVGREMRFSADGEFLGYGQRLTASPSDIHIRNIENFDMAVYELECELNALMREGA